MSVESICQIRVVILALRSIPPLLALAISDSPRTIASHLTRKMGCVCETKCKTAVANFEHNAQKNSISY
jgi:hypothetical protein